MNTTNKPQTHLKINHFHLKREQRQGTRESQGMRVCTSQLLSFICQFLSLKCKRCCCFSLQVPTELISKFKNNYNRKNGSQFREIIK